MDDGTEAGFGGETPEESLARLDTAAKRTSSRGAGDGPRFRQVRSRGYEMEAVDRFFDGLGARSAAEIDHVEFPVTRKRLRYDMAQVDAALDAQALEVRQSSPEGSGDLLTRLVDKPVVIRRMATQVGAWLLILATSSFGVFMMLVGYQFSDKLASVFGALIAVGMWHGLARPALVISPTGILMRQVGYDRFIPWEEYVRASGRPGIGLEIVHSSGHRYTSSAFPGAVAAQISGDPTMRHALELLPPNPHPIDIDTAAPRRQWKPYLPVLIGAPALAVLGSALAARYLG